ncbi:MAG TPA: MFS transporter [Burkholderiales bacterium]|nr:MFS transporter [Burkholderiales bacterium]
MHSTTSGKPLDVIALLDAAPSNRFTASVVVLCALVALLDGYDTLAISYAAPVIAAEWSMPKEAFGPIFAATFLGAAAGAALFGMLADRYGRRPTIILATAMFGVFALLTPLSRDLASLLVIRGLTGIGLGGALANVIALVAEYAPARSRATLVSSMYAAFPLGGVFGGPLSAYLIQQHGWQAVFVVGGAAPLVLVFFLVLALPESVRYLVVRAAPAVRVVALLRRAAPHASVSSGDRFVVAEGSAARLPLTAVFSGAYLRPTALLCLASFITQMVIAFVITWMPMLLKDAGLPLGRAIVTAATFSLGGIVGSLLLARIIDTTHSYRPLVAMYVASAFVIALIGFCTFSAPALFAVVGLAGIAIVGSQVNLSAYSTTVYPTQIRTTGVGWITGVGRVGAIAGALVGTVFLSAGFALHAQYVIAGVPALLAALAVAFARPRGQYSQMVGIQRNTSPASATRPYGNDT